MSQFIRVAVTKYCRQGWLINNRNLLFTVQEAGKLKINELADLERALFVVQGWLSFHCVFMAEGGIKLSGVGFCKVTKLIHEGLALMTQSLP